MQVAPKPPGLLLGTPLSIVKTFVKLRDVIGDVACLDLGRKRLDYRGILKIQPINFALLSEEDQDGVIEGFKAFLNGFAYPIQILVRNRPYNMEGYLQQIESIDGDLAEMMRDHALFLRQLAARRAIVKRQYYIIVPADRQNSGNQAEALLNAQMQISLRIEELQRQLEHVSLVGQRLRSAEIVALYQSCITPLEAHHWPITQGMVDGTNKLMVSANGQGRVSSGAIQGYSIGEQERMIERVAEEIEQRTKQAKSKDKKAKREALPDFVHVPDLIAPSAIQIFPSYIRIDGESGHEYTRTLALVSYPRSAYFGWLDNIIRVDEPHVDFSIHIEPLLPEQVNARLGRKVVEFRGSVLVAQRQGRTPDPETMIALEDVEQLRENLARGNERVFKMAVYIQLRAQDRQTLMARNDRIVAAVRSLDFRALPVHWQHHMGMLSCLPDGTDLLARGRLLGTGAASTFFPFTGSDIGMDSGVMFGVHPNGGLIVINPFDSNHLENANLVVFAKSGAGKSFFLKTIASRLLPSCNVYVIDPEAEYNQLCQQVKGQVVRLSSEALPINPFELYSQITKFSALEPDEQKKESNFFREKIMNIITMLELLLSDEGVLPQKEKAFLYKCLLKTYENRGINMDPATHMRQPPNMQEFFVIMSSALRGDERFGTAEDTYGLSERLERYVHLFPARTRLVLNNRFIDFSIRELNDTLKPIGLFLITEFLWTKMRQARRARTLQDNTIILIDEAWLLMQFPQGAKFLEEFARRIRKYGGGLWCTTQNSDDFLNSEEGKTILAMATMKFLMKQDASTIDSVVRTFKLSDGQKSYLMSARRGEGLFATKSWTPMEVIASPREAAMADTTMASTLSQAQPLKPGALDDALSMNELERDLKAGGRVTGKLVPTGKLPPHTTRTITNEHMH